MMHQHTYDKHGKQLCCAQEEKIYTNAGAKELLKNGHSEHDDHYGHDHMKYFIYFSFSFMYR